VTTLYHSLDRRQHLSQPQMGRARHRWRGWRESGKLNLEMQQFYFDVATMHARTTAQEETFEASVDILLDGGAVVPTTDTEGLDPLLLRANALLDRVRVLETGG